MLQLQGHCVEGVVCHQDVLSGRLCFILSSINLNLHQNAIPLTHPQPPFSPFSPVGLEGKGTSFGLKHQYGLSPKIDRVKSSRCLVWIHTSVCVGSALSGHALYSHGHVHPTVGGGRHVIRTSPLMRSTCVNTS